MLASVDQHLQLPAQLRQDGEFRPDVVGQKILPAADGDRRPAGSVGSIRHPCVHLEGNRQIQIVREGGEVLVEAGARGVSRIAHQQHAAAIGVLGLPVGAGRVNRVGGSRKRAALVAGDRIVERCRAIAAGVEIVGQMGQSP